MREQGDTKTAAPARHTVLITGAAGYVGAMLCDMFSARDDVARVVGLDVEERPALLQDKKNIEWIRANTANAEQWRAGAEEYAPDIVIHAAWHIREMYSKREEQRRWNIEGTRQVFALALGNPSVKRLIHFSSAACYGATPDNTLTHYFKEDEPLRDSPYSYAQEKKEAEELLRKMWEAAPAAARPQVAVVRPAAITGPRGRYLRVRFGLQSALAGQLSGNFFYRAVSALTAFVPVTRGWVRQYVHEDDVADILALLAFHPWEGAYEAFNLTPPGEPVYGADMARAVGKRTLPVTPSMVRIAFWLFWHASRGTIPTCRGSWLFYSYPVLMDGSKVTRVLGYTYRYPSRESFYYTAGRYERYLPEEARTAPAAPEKHGAR